MQDLVELHHTTTGVHMSYNFYDSTEPNSFPADGAAAKVIICTKWYAKDDIPMSDEMLMDILGTDCN